MSLIVPIPRVNVGVRVATVGDIPFMDALQKRNGKALGHFPTKQFEGYVEMGAVLVAETAGQRVGYIIHRDRYLKRDELGVIFQLCVTAGEQRKLVGATLVREAFERSAYGCRLYCLWCAQDLDANHFWESLGFVPIAFRAGGARKVRVRPARASASRRVHIFWQKRICEGDTGQAGTRWWYPFQTSGGAIRQDRLVFPIPPGVHWKDVQPIVLEGTAPARIDGSTKAPTKPRKTSTAPKAGPGPGMVGIMVGGRIKYIPRPGYVAPVEATKPEPKPKREKPPAPKFDPKLLAKVREFRDRWLEYVEANGLPSAGSIEAKYDVRRMLPQGTARPEPSATKALPRAA